MMSSGDGPSPIDGQSQIYKMPLEGGDGASGSSRGKKKPSWAKGSNARFNFTVHTYVTAELEAAADAEAARQREEHLKGHPKSPSSSATDATAHAHAHKDGCCGSKKDSRQEALKARAKTVEDMLSQLKLGSKPSQKQPLTPSTQPAAQLEDTQEVDKFSQKPVRKYIGSSRDTNPPNTPYFELRIGLGFSVPMFEKCLKTMLPGERARFLCMPEECEGYAQLETILRQEKENRSLIARGLPPVRTTGCCAQSAMLAATGNSSVLTAQRDLLLCASGAAPLELELELLDVLEPGGFQREVWEMTAVDKYTEFPARRMEGTELYRRGEYAAACDKYARALVLLESLSQSPAVTDMQRQMTKDREACDKEVRRRVLERRRLERLGKLVPNEFTAFAVETYIKECEELVKSEDFSGNQGINPKLVIENMQICRLNYAACKLKLGEYSAVVVQCSEVIKNDPTSIKALFRRAQAHRKIGRDLDLAQADLTTLRELLVSRGVAEDHMEFVELKKEEKDLDLKLKEAAKKEKMMFSNMFS
ncbi:hypothetical protein BC830DRAFT_1214117 [Chytriomyces sp. MP71]|nr:hypothetical protein BC830DRAFT_1214117 [Chytriomyces sp. MP71]